MPTYQHSCKTHGKFEDVRPISRSSELVACPKCGELCEQNFDGTTRMVGAIVGSGDTTSILKNADGSDYRLKERTKKDQRREILQELNRREEDKVRRGEIPEGLRRVYDIQ